jgi:hypothetical protein
MIANYDPDDFDPIKTLNKIIRAILIGLISLIILASSQCHAQSDERAEMVEYIAGFGIEHPEIVYAQMMLESGNLNCKNCSWSNYNNAFGFHNGKRYLKYDNLEHCLEGFKEWQNWRCPDCKTKEEYYNCLVKYWGAPNMVEYIDKLKAIE